jgi:hypothetical protein
MLDYPPQAVLFFPFFIIFRFSFVYSNLFYFIHLPICTEGACGFFGTSAKGA